MIDETGKTLINALVDATKAGKTQWNEIDCKIKLNRKSVIKFRLKLYKGKVYLEEYSDAGALDRLINEELT